MLNNPSGKSWRSAAVTAMAADESLSDTWRALNVSLEAQNATPDDVATLVELIKKRIQPVNAFDLLARIDISVASDVLYSRYLSDDVCPDSKFGGFLFELSGMLDSIVEASGRDKLLEVVKGRDCGNARLKDPRVVEAFTDALDIPFEGFNAWLCSGPETCK